MGMAAILFNDAEPFSIYLNRRVFVMQSTMLNLSRAAYDGVCSDCLWPAHCQKHPTARSCSARVARFVHGDYKTTSSTSKMISSLCRESLQQRRTDARLVMIYRITHDPADIPAAQFLRPATVSPFAAKTNATCYHSVESMCNHCSQLESVFGINCRSMLQQPGSWKPSRWA